ncbi:MAG: hypothetical protein AMJ93_04135 [Anaerolineae bacterium SM23_84]|nr:MAG: hypothetical protein AMJ93_04135 [Anaerolineae bacterium SM23_84]
MAVRPTRRTQTAEYWLEEFAANGEDLEHLYEWLVEESEPRTIEQLSFLVLEHRCNREEEALLKQGDRGVIYQPQDEYEVGQRIVFPAFDYATAEVVAVRDGNNPRYGPFRVIKVQLENESTSREFAAGLLSDHALQGSAALLEDTDLLSVDQLYALYGQNVREQVQDALSHNDDFVHFAGRWYLRGLIPQVTPFHLNIAEAMIYERAQPLTLSELLEEVEFPPETKASAQEYALSHGLNHDSRFAEISTGSQSAWYLSALIPGGVRDTPTRLVPAYRTQGGEWLNRELNEFVAELGDEADELDGKPAAASGSTDSVEILLTYPHRREGTLPLTSRALGMLSEKPADRFMVTFLDPLNREKISGWMVPSERYAWGLAEWYHRHDLPVGALLELRRGDDPFTFLVSYERGRRRSEWIREAAASGGQLNFSMQRRAYGCRYDKNVLIAETSVDALDDLWTTVEDAESLFEHLVMIFPELAKLSGQGLVHAKTLYSAVNMTLRCGAVPIFAELTRRACFDPVGDGNWVYDGLLGHVTYKTPEDMSERTRSNRHDLIVDRVYQYAASDEG